MNPLIDKCPVCTENLIITHLYCSHCRTTIEGKFNLPSSPLSRLNPDQMHFLLTFIRCEGKFNRMEEELNLSYPTLRNRFNEILQLMGMSAEENAELSLSPEERKKVLHELSKGHISADEAHVRLMGEKAKPAK